MPTKKPWDQLESESDAAYARFLIYRNLGRGRSLRKAFARSLRDQDLYHGDYRKLNLPANWRSDSSAHRWLARASAWDVHNLISYGTKIAVLHINAMHKIAKKHLKATEEYKVGDDAWDNVLATSRHLAEFLTPDVIDAIRERLASAGRDAASQTAAVTPTSPTTGPDE